MVLGRVALVTGLADAVRWLLDRSHLLEPTELPAAVDQGARAWGRAVRSLPSSIAISTPSFRSAVTTARR